MKTFLNEPGFCKTFNYTGGDLQGAIPEIKPVWSTASSLISPTSIPTRARSEFSHTVSGSVLDSVTGYLDIFTVE